MKIIKILNNNVIYAKDQVGYAIVMGKGIGYFGKAGKNADDSLVEKIIRINSEKNSQSLIQDLQRLDAVYFELANDIVEYAINQSGLKLNSNVYITLTDHISFSLERQQKGIIIANPLLLDIKHYYPTEFKIGLYAIKLIKERFNEDLGENEAAFIALHIVCARYNFDINGVVDTTKMVTKIITAIESFFKCEFDDGSFAYQRFVTHLRFLSERIISHDTWTELDGLDNTLISTIKSAYPLEYDCSLLVKADIENEYEYQLNEMELAYLTIHLRNMLKKPASNEGGRRCQK